MSNLSPEQLTSFNIVGNQITQAEMTIKGVIAPLCAIASAPGFTGLVPINPASLSLIANASTCISVSYDLLLRLLSEAGVDTTPMEVGPNGESIADAYRKNADSLWSVYGKSVACMDRSTIAVDVTTALDGLCTVMGMVSPFVVSDAAKARNADWVEFLGVAAAKAELQGVKVDPANTEAFVDDGDEPEEPFSAPRTPTIH